MKDILVTSIVVVAITVIILVFSFWITGTFDTSHNGIPIYGVFSVERGGGLFGGSRDGFWAVEYRQHGDCFEDACGRKLCVKEYSITLDIYSSQNGYLHGVCFQKFPSPL